MESASVKRRSISCCEGPFSWCEYSTGMPIFSSVSTVSRRRSAGVVQRREVEVAPAVEHLGALGVFEVEEFQFGAHVEHVAHLRRLLHRAGQHVARVALERRAVGRADAAEHARHGRCARAAKAALGTSPRRERPACRTPECGRSPPRSCRRSPCRP